MSALDSALPARQQRRRTVMVATKSNRILRAATGRTERPDRERIGRDFGTFVDDDQVCAFNIMSMPDLTRAEGRRKVMLIGKKLKAEPQTAD